MLLSSEIKLFMFLKILFWMYVCVCACSPIITPVYGGQRKKHLVSSLRWYHYLILLGTGQNSPSRLDWLRSRRDPPVSSHTPPLASFSNGIKSMLHHAQLFLCVSWHVTKLPPLSPAFYGTFYWSTAYVEESIYTLHCHKTEWDPNIEIKPQKSTYIPL